MADKQYIEREAARKFLAQDYAYAAADLLKYVPAADVVEVVRCKDCIYAKPYERQDGETGYYCQNNNSTFRYGTNWERLYEPIREADGFCSYGERKE